MQYRKVFIFPLDIIISNLRSAMSQVSKMSKTVRMVEMEMNKTPKTAEWNSEWKSIDKIYSCVCENPGESLHEMSEELGMPHENVNKVLDELKSAGLVKFKFVRMSPVVKKIYPIDKKFIMTSKLKKELKKFINQE